MGAIKHNIYIYAQEVAEDSYLDIESKSLNNKTYKGSIQPMSKGNLKELPLSI